MAPIARSLLLAAVAGCLQAAAFQVTSVSFADLAQDGPFFDSQVRKTFEAALSEVGVVAVANIPGYDALRTRVLQEAHRCIKASPTAVSHEFEDGTVRRSLAGVKSASGAQEIPIGNGAAAACAAFKQSSTEFRDMISRVSDVFGARLGSLLGLEADSGPIMRSAEEGRSYETLSDIFHHGEHLEHFHSYHLPKRQWQARSHSPDKTIDFHTDQGLCIAFTSALLVDESSHGVRGTEGSTGEFQIELQSGRRVPVEFASGHLVFMLGDGVNQYLNSRVRSGLTLRATPHAMTMPDHAQGEYRLWYGRMFLPPVDAINEASGISYGDIRDLMTHAWVTGEGAEGLSLGCSGSQRARELSGDDGNSPTCGAGQMYCWFRCMDYTTDASPEVCEGQDLRIQCTNRRDEFSDGKHHGDYAPRCSNTTQPVRGSCELELINSDRPSTCTASGFEAFVFAQGAGLKERHDLLTANDAAELVFMWSVTSMGKVQAMLAFNGRVSWMALGIANSGAKKNGMHGAPVVFGISGDDGEYPSLVGVNEYTIHDTQSRFYMWNTPHPNPALTDTELTSESCYTAMKFTTDSIAGVPLNITTGSNNLIWALRASSYMSVGKDSYHEGCANGERVRYRGGGDENSWIVSFQGEEEDLESTETSGASALQVSLVVFVLALIAVCDMHVSLVTYPAQI